MRVADTSTVLIILAILSAGFLIYMGGYLIAEQLKRAVSYMDDASRLAVKRLSEPDDPIKAVVTTVTYLVQDQTSNLQPGDVEVYAISSKMCDQLFQVFEDINLKYINRAKETGDKPAVSLRVNRIETPPEFIGAINHGIIVEVTFTAKIDSTFIPNTDQYIMRSIALKVTDIIGAEPNLTVICIGMNVSNPM